MTKQTPESGIKTAPKLKRLLNRRELQWVTEVFKNPTHDAIADRMHIAFQTSRSYQKVISEKLDLSPGQKKIPHIMVYLINKRLITWALMVALFQSFLFAPNNDFRRPTNGRMAHRSHRTRRREDDLGYT